MVATLDAVPRVRFADRSAFADELRTCADAYFKDHVLRRRDLPRMYGKSLIILVWFVSSWALLVFVAASFSTALLLAVSLGLSVAAIGMSVMHDANHGAYSRHVSVNRLFGSTLDLMGVNSFIWRHKHNVLHHTFTNIEGVDYDVDFGLLARLTPGQSRRSWHRYQHFYLWFFYGFLLPKWVFHDDFVIWRARHIGRHPLPRPGRREWVLFVAWKLAFVAWAVGIPFAFHSLLEVIFFHAVAAFTLGLTLGTTFQLAHCLGEADFPVPPAEPAKMQTDWSLHQLDTTVDFATQNPFVTWFCGGLNFQVEHHLFPKVCHLHYPALARIVDEVGARHGATRRTNMSLRDAVGSHFRHLRRLGRVWPLAPQEVTEFPLRDRIRLHSMGHSVRAAELDAGRAVLRLDDLELDAAVLLPRRLVVPRVLRAVLAVALAPQARSASTPRCDERRDDRVHAVLREVQVVLVARALVGVAGDLDEHELRVVRDRRRHRVEDLVRLGEDLGADAVLNLILSRMTMLLSWMMTLPLSGQPSSSSKPLNVSGSFGHLSDDVGDAVLVVVRIGAAVLRPRSRPCPRGRSGTGRACRGCRPGRCPGRGSRPASWKPSRSSGSSGHLSFESGMPSPSRSPSLALGAAVGVLIAVAVLGLVGAAVVDVGDAVVVVVRVGAAVLVLEAVEVLRARRGTCRRRP